MTVKQLIEELKKFSPNADVFVETEDAWDSPSIAVDEDGQVIITMEYYGIRKEGDA